MPQPLSETTGGSFVVELSRTTHVPVVTATQQTVTLRQNTDPNTTNDNLASEGAKWVGNPKIININVNHGLLGQDKNINF